MCKSNKKLKKKLFKNALQFKIFQGMAVNLPFLKDLNAVFWTNVHQNARIARRTILKIICPWNTTKNLKENMEYMQE